MIFYIGGVSGVGKTVVIEYLTEKHRQIRGFRLVRAPVKELLCEYARVASVVEYRTLPKTFRSSLHSMVTERIYRLDKEDSRLIQIYDSHFCALDSHGRVEAVRPMHASDKGQLLAIAILIAKSNVILSRRMSDEAARHDRFVGDCKFICREQEFEVETALSQAKTLSIPLECFRNEESLDEISQRLSSFLEWVAAERKTRQC